MTTWRKNEPTPAKREAVLQIFDSSTGKPADRGTNFIALGIVFIRGANTPNLDIALGTMTNERRPLAVTPTTFTVNTGVSSTNLLATAHGLQNGDGPIRLTTTGGLPTGLAINTDYYVIFVDANTFKLASSLANAYAGTAITMSSNGTGTNQFTGVGTTPMRGLDGRFVYRATQGETNIDASEMEVVIDDGGTGNFGLVNSAGGTATVTMSADGTDWSGILEGGITRDMALRALLRGEVAKKTLSGATITTRDLADSKNSHHGDVTAAGGRISAVVDDLT